MVLKEEEDKWGEVQVSQVEGRREKRRAERGSENKWGGGGGAGRNGSREQIRLDEQMEEGFEMREGGGVKRTGKLGGDGNRRGLELLLAHIVTSFCCIFGVKIIARKSFSSIFCP